MGYLHVGDLTVELDDRALTHLEVVLVQRFNERKNVLLSWLDPLKEGDGRSTVWLAWNTVVHFKFTGSRPPAIDRDWLQQLQQRADSGTGLVMCDEHGRLLRATARRGLRP